MNFDEYQKKVHSTAQYPTNITVASDDDEIENPMPWAYPVIGLPAETGEILNQFKKVIRDDEGIITEERAIDIKDEMGDTLWYLAEICNSLNWSLNDIAKNNIAKLALRLRNNQIHGDKR